MTRRTCIIAEGGGLRAAYGVGVVRALIDEFKITTVDVAVATSGSAGTLAYYVTQQFDSLLNIWTNLLTTWRFISLRNALLGKPILNVDYLIDVVFKQQDRLDIETLKSKATELYLPVTNYHTGEAEYFSNHDSIDFFEALRATKAIEIFYGRSVKIGKQEYVDGALSTPIGITKAIDAGATDIIVISTRPKGFRRSRSALGGFFTQLLTSRCPERLKERIGNYPDTYNSVLDKVKREIEFGDRNIVLIQPDSKVGGGKLDNSKESLLRSIEQGYADTCMRKELNCFGV